MADRTTISIFRPVRLNVAMGQKPTFAQQRGTSALLRITTAKADIGAVNALESVLMENPWKQSNIVANPLITLGAVSHSHGTRLPAKRPDRFKLKMRFQSPFTLSTVRPPDQLHINPLKPLLGYAKSQAFRSVARRDVSASMMMRPCSSALLNGSFPLTTCLRALSETTMAGSRSVASSAVTRGGSGRQLGSKPFTVARKKPHVRLSISNIKNSGRAKNSLFGSACSTRS